jgi:GDP-L-fucose synthase
MKCVMNKDSKIFIAGHRGLVGSAIVRRLELLGYKNIITAGRECLDLRSQASVEYFFENHKPDYVFDAAAKVGGIYANDTYSADFIYDNIMIQTNLIHNSWKYGVKKFLFLGSVCIYPKFASIPVKEESLLTGILEPTNEAYAIAKISGAKMCQFYSKQYGFKSLTIMPSNLYGINDNFHPDNGHVIPAMFTKFRLAKQECTDVTFWGDGTAYREFMYCDDMADACIFLMIQQQYENGEIINAGSGYNISIKELSEKIARIVDFKGKILWDTSRPNGTPIRPLDFTKIEKLGWSPKYDLDYGLALTYDWLTKRNNP